MIERDIEIPPPECMHSQLAPSEFWWPRGPCRRSRDAESCDPKRL